MQINLPFTAIGAAERASERIVDMAQSGGPGCDGLVVLTENSTSLPLVEGSFDVLEQWLHFISPRDGAMLGGTRITDSERSGIVRAMSVTRTGETWRVLAIRSTMRTPFEEQHAVETYTVNPTAGG